jgi:hypothetical protein
VDSHLHVFIAFSRIRFLNVKTDGVPPGYLVAHDVSIPCSVPLPLSERPANMIAQALGRIVLYPVL